MSSKEISEIKIRWDRIVRQAANELSRLPPGDRAWLADRLAVIADLKRRMHLIFVGAEGARQCAACMGACCGSGRNHSTLVELLTFLCENESFPAADFERSCPFIGPAGCAFIPERRPFNCIVFLCEAIESSFSAAERKVFNILETELRNRYAEFDKRFPGSSLRGLLIRSATLDGRPLLSRSG